MSRRPKPAPARVLAGLAVLMVLAACSSGVRGPSVAGPSALPSGIGSPSVAAPTPPAVAPTQSSASPAAQLPGAPVALTHGSAEVTMTGGASESFDLTLTSGILIPGTNVILAWSGSAGDESGDDGLRIQAPSQAGVYQSGGDDFGAPQIGVSTGRIGTAGVPPEFGPAGDECTLTLTKVDATGVEGSLECHGMTSIGFDQAVDVEATFTATP